MWARKHSKYTVSAVVPQRFIDVVAEIAVGQGMRSADVVRTLLLEGHQHPEVVTHLAPFLWRTHRKGTVTWEANALCLNLDELLIGHSWPAVRVEIALTKSEWFELDSLAYALCRSIHDTASAVFMVMTEHDEARSAVLAHGLRTLAYAQASVFGSTRGSSLSS